MGLGPWAIVTVRYILQGIGLLCSYALYGTLLVQSGQESPTFVTDSTSRLLGLPSACSRHKREASLDDLFRGRGDQQPEEVLDQLQEGFLKAIDQVKSSYSDLDVISAVEASWNKENQTKVEDDELDIYTAVPLDKGKVDSVDELGSTIFNGTVDNEGQDDTSQGQEEISLAVSEGSGDLSMEDLEVNDGVINQVKNLSGALHQDEKVIEQWMQQFGESYSAVTVSNQSTMATKGQEVDVVKPVKLPEDHVGNSSSSTLNRSALAGVFSLKMTHPKLFPGVVANKTEEEGQTKETDQEGFTEEEQRFVNILLGAAYSVLVLTMLLLIYVLTWSDFSICKARARYQIAEKNARSQQGLAHQFMDIASERESLRVKTRALEKKLKETTNLGDVAILTGLDQEQPGDYTINIQKNLDVKKGMDEAQLEEVRQNVAKNQEIVSEMSRNISG